jgi:DNA-directed RNA polymerase omega subunit
MKTANRISVEDFREKVDTLYRLVIVASRRAQQLSKPDARPLVEPNSKKPMMIALQEMLEGKIEAHSGEEDDEAVVE